MTRELATNPCKGTCAWSATGTTLADQPLFVCAGCGSEWTPEQAWTPQDADAIVSAEVAAARAAAAS